jgi:aminoglycoside phosphotransferase (APT) family kinase protein
MAAQNMPAAEIDISAELVRSLLRAQHPDLDELPVELAENGWDNAVFRLGEDLAVRVPRRAVASGLVILEQRWLAELAPRLPLPIPVPVRVGVPTAAYPWHWSVCDWFHGEVAAEAALASPSLEAHRIGEFVAALHQPAPAELPPSPVLRGGPLTAVGERIAVNAARLSGLVDVSSVMERWKVCSSVDEWRGPPLWVHGDLHTANVLVERGAIGAVIDFGDICAGDPAVDLAIAWMLFDRADRQVFREAAGGPAGIDDATWARGEAWALHFAVLYLLHSADNARFARMGARLLATVMAGA